VFEKFGINAATLLREYHEKKKPELVPVAAEDLVGNQGDYAARMDIARILDANANRAREALRILEDFTRFSLDDGHLSSRLKSCRHQLQEALTYLPSDWMVMARATEADVGTSISTSSELHRANLTAVVTANAKRAQESVRTLEEYAKLESMEAARLLEQIRYELYSIERLLFIGRRGRDRLSGAFLYWLLDPSACAATLDWMIDRAAQGGVDVIQLRDKKAADRELMETARLLRQWTAEKGILFIVNDRPDIARLCGADGVHVGQEELRVKDVRKIVGPDCLIGVSTHSIEQARQACREGADYLGSLAWILSGRRPERSPCPFSALAASMARTSRRSPRRVAAA
jgi:thiamine-phosphate pyrophosphorylase